RNAPMSTGDAPCTSRMRTCTASGTAIVARRFRACCVWYGWSKYANADPASARHRRMTAANEITSWARRPRGNMLVRHELVADAPNGLDTDARASDLLPQSGDVNVNGSRIADVVVAPDEMDQPLPIEDDARIPGQGQEK